MRKGRILYPAIIHGRLHALAVELSLSFSREVFNISIGNRAL